MAQQARTRPPLDLGDEAAEDEEGEALDLSGFGTKESGGADPGNDKIHQVAKKSGFTGGAKRDIGAPPALRRRRRSPFTDQKGIKCRPEDRDRFEDLAAELGVTDGTLFQMLLECFESEGRKWLDR